MGEQAEIIDRDNFDEIIDRRGSSTIKYDLLKPLYGSEDVIPLWVADMDFPSPPAIKEALAGVLEWNTWGYTIAGKKDAEALSAYWARRHNVHFSAEDVLMIETQ